MKDCIYLDNNATTKIDEDVLSAMLPYLIDYYGNPSSAHSFGKQAKKAIYQARIQVSSLLGAKNSEIVFTSCGTEGDNMAILSSLKTKSNKNHIITTKVEHSAILNLCTKLEKEGYIITYLSVDRKGQIDLNELQNSLSENTALVSIMYANNETGVIFPIEEIGNIVKQYDVIFHVDGVQIVGKVPLNMKNSTIDLLTLSAHKIHGPKGIGCLYVRENIKLQPLLVGGNQEYKRRGGTENVAGIVGLGKAAELATIYLNTAPKVKYLRDKLEKGILSTISNTFINGDIHNRLFNTTNIGFQDIEGEGILSYLDKFKIYASSGSACTSGSVEPSHVLKALKIPYNILHGSIRFSLSRFTKESEIDYVLEILPNIINQLRNIYSLRENESKQLKESNIIVAI